MIDITEVKKLIGAFKCICNAYFRTFQLTSDEVVIPGAEPKLSVKACSSMDIPGVNNYTDDGHCVFNFPENFQCLYKVSL